MEATTDRPPASCPRTSIASTPSRTSTAATTPAHGGHGGHGGHGDHAAQFRDRFWLSLVLTVPVVLYSEMVQEWLGFTPPQFPGSQWVAPVLGTIVFLYGGRPFLEGGVAELRSRQPGMMLLISLAILVAFGASVATAVRRVRPGVLVGAGPADRDHAAGPLAGDAGPRPGLQRAGRPGGAAARRGRPGHPRRGPGRCRSATWPWATWSWSARAAGSRPTAWSSTGRPSWTSR